MSDFIDLSEQHFKVLLSDLLSTPYDFNIYMSALKNSGMSNFIVNKIITLSCKYKTGSIFISDLSLDYFINCIYEMYGPISYDHSYDKYLNRIEIGDYIISGSCILSKYTNKSSNRYKHKLVEVKGYSNRYLESSDIIKYNNIPNNTN